MTTLPHIPLNHDSRARIVDAIMTHAYGETDRQEAEAEDALLRKVHAEIYKDALSWVKKAPKGWIDTTNKVRLSIADGTVHGLALASGSKETGPQSGRWAEDALPIPHSAGRSWPANLSLTNAKLSKEVMAFAQAREKRNEEKRQRKVQVEAVVYRCRTLKALLTAWPDCEGLVFPLFKDAAPSTALAVIPKDLSAALKLPA